MLNATDPILLKTLREDEGVVPYAYQDHLGFWTIGVGRLIDKRKGGGLSSQEIDFLLANDVEKRIEALNKAIPWWTSLNDPRKRVLVNMAFQLGVGGLLNFKNTLAAVQRGDYTAAAQGMFNSTWAKQTPERAARLCKIMQTGKE